MMADKSSFPPLSRRSSREAFEDRCQCDGQGSNPSKEDPRLTAADALAEKADQLLECIRMGWADGEAYIALDAALRAYREVAK